MQESFCKILPPIVAAAAVVVVIIGERFSGTVSVMRKLSLSRNT